jgi:hypothetical protein
MKYIFSISLFFLLSLLLVSIGFFRHTQVKFNIADVKRVLLKESLTIKDSAFNSIQEQYKANFKDSIFTIDSLNENTEIDGKYIVQKTIKIPKNKTLIIKEGSVILFGKHAGIFCEGKIIAHGSKEHPIYFLSLNNSVNSKWGNITVYGEIDEHGIANMATGEFSHCYWYNGGGRLSQMGKNYLIGNSAFGYNENCILNCEYKDFGEMIKPAKTIRGGAILGYLAIINVDDCMFYNNKAAVGGAICIRSGDLTVENTNFIKNTAEYVHRDSSDSRAGAAIFYSSKSFEFDSITVAQYPTVKSFNKLENTLKVSSSNFIENGPNINGEIPSTETNTSIFYIGNYAEDIKISKNKFLNNFTTKDCADLSIFDKLPKNDKTWVIDENIFASSRNFGNNKIASSVFIENNMNPCFIRANSFYNCTDSVGDDLKTIPYITINPLNKIRLEGNNFDCSFFRSVTSNVMINYPPSYVQSFNIDIRNNSFVNAFAGYGVKLEKLDSSGADMQKNEMVNIHKDRQDASYFLHSTSLSQNYFQSDIKFLIVFFCFSFIFLIRGFQTIIYLFARKGLTRIPVIDSISIIIFAVIDNLIIISDYLISRLFSLYLSNLIKDKSLKELNPYSLVGKHKGIPIIDGPNLEGSKLSVKIDENDLFEKLIKGPIEKLSAILEGRMPENLNNHNKTRSKLKIWLLNLYIELLINSQENLLPLFKMMLRRNKVKVIDEQNL